MKRSRLLACFAAFLVLSLAPTVHAQPTPAQLDRIVALVESGELTEAKIRVETLLEVYPDDPQLKQMSTLLAQQLKNTPKPPTNPALDRIRSALSAPPSSVEPLPEALSATDRLEIETLLQGAQLALQTSDSSARADKLKNLLARAVPDTARISMRSDWLPYWQTRAVAALELKDWKQGWQAGQALLRLKALESETPSLRQVMTTLNVEGWLQKNPQVIETAAMSKRWQPWLGAWKAEASCTYRNKGDGYSTSTGYQNQKITLSIGLIENEPKVQVTWLIDTRDSTWRGDNPSGYQSTSSTNIPGKSTVSGRDWGRKTTTSNFSSSSRILNISLGDSGDTLSIKYESKSDDTGVATVAENRYMLSEDGRQLYILSKDTGQTRESFARYNGSLYICKDYTYFDAPIIVALAKQN